MMHNIELPFPINTEQWIEDNSWLLKILQLSKERGFIGRSTDLRSAIRHSLGYAVVIDYLFGMGIDFGLGTDLTKTTSLYPSVKPLSENEHYKCKIIDVGTGGGIPGIPVVCYLAREYVDIQATFLDASIKKTSFLEYVLGLNEGQSRYVTTRVSVINKRAELCGREPSYRGSFQVAIARSLAKPATTVELCSPLLQLGGYLVVSLDPHSITPLLWPDKGLEKFGMIKIGEVNVDEYRYLAVTQALSCPDVYPRRIGVPSKKPVW